MKTAIVTYLTVYLLAFVRTFWPHISLYQAHEARAIIDEIVLTTDATPHEALRLVNISAMESGFDRTAVSRDGTAFGALQVSNDGGLNHDFSAREALRRMRVQGMVGYVGCRHEADRIVVQGKPMTCAQLIAQRVDRADLYWMAFDLLQDLAVAGNP